MALYARYHRAYVDIFERDRLEPDWVPYDTFTYDTFDKWVVSEDV